MNDIDTAIRLWAFEFVKDQQLVYGDAIPRDVLISGFTYDGVRVPLLSPQGIFKPKILPEVPLSFTTVPVVEGKPRPYDDEFDVTGRIRYRYRGTDPWHRDNAGLRRCIDAYPWSIFTE